MPGLEKQLDTFLRACPRLGEGVYLTSTAVVIGDVRIGEHSSIWYGTVLRGDINRIEIGHHTNIQDNSVVHLSDRFPAVIGNYVTVGHSAVVHACTVEDECLVGMRSVIMDGAVVGRQSLVGAGALVPEGMQIPPGSLVLGSPARIVRPLKPEEKAHVLHLAKKYAAIAVYCLEHQIQVGAPLES